MSDIKASHIKAKMLLVIAILGIFAIIWKFSSDQNQFSNLNLTKGNVNYSFTLDSCRNYAGIEKAKCYIEEGNLNDSIEVCRNLSAEDKSNCYQGIALSITSKNINNLNASLNTSIELCNMAGGRFYCYTNLAAVAVKSHTDVAVFLCNLTSPPDICYGTIGRVLSYQDVDRALEICNTSGVGVCYESVADVVLKKDIDKAVSICRIVNSESCYTSAAGYIAGKNTEKDLNKAISICNEYMDFCSGSICGCPHCCHIETAGKVAVVNIEGALTICENLSGINKAHCYYRIIPDVNNTANKSYIERLCSYMINIWGEDTMIMRYCNNILPLVKKIK